VLLAHIYYYLMIKKLLILATFIALLFSGCKNPASSKKEVIIFHAGSLSVPFKELKREYEKRNPSIKILLEPAGSLVCARKITELKKPCDIIASADYFVINELLIPNYASWSVRFATNELVIAYHEKSRHSSEINADNWIDILSMNDVIYSRSDPDSDPCGYRTVLAFMLAEKYYKKEGLTGKMVSKNLDFIRPKEVDLIALLESDAIDYMFQYKSVAIQHKLKYIKLPDEINLSDPSKAEIYKSVFINVTGSKPGSKMRVTGEYINYSMTVPDIAIHRDEAIDFMCFMLSDEGLEIFRKNGQDPIIPFSTEQPDKLPSKLLHYLHEYKVN
jgi:molybdate/tungstate transport system substrate-binding protein